MGNTIHADILASKKITVSGLPDRFQLHGFLSILKHITILVKKAISKVAKMVNDVHFLCVE